MRENQRFRLRRAMSVSIVSSNAVPLEIPAPPAKPSRRQHEREQSKEQCAERVAPAVASKRGAFHSKSMSRFLARRVKILSIRLGRN